LIPHYFAVKGNKSVRRGVLRTVSRESMFVRRKEKQ